MLEQLPVTERYRAWIDAVAQQFGGLDLCALEVLVAKDGREHIMELNDSALPLLGDTQEEDRRLISELVLHRMSVSNLTTAFYSVNQGWEFMPQPSISRRQFLNRDFPFHIELRYQNKAAKWFQYFQFQGARYFPSLIIFR